MSALQEFTKKLSKVEADGAIISSQLNIRYLCDFDYTDGYLVIFPDAAYLLADFRYIEAARKKVRGFDIIMPKSTMLSEIHALLSKHGAKAVLIEDGSVTLSEFSKMREALSAVTLSTGATELLSEQRQIKTEYELQAIARAQAVTDAAFEHILGFITSERTEIEVALELEFFMRSNGAESVAFDTIAVSGPSSSLPHGVPSNQKLSRGFLTIDFGARVDGYCSDMTRTVVIGKADGEMKKVYGTVLSAQRAALEAICEGISCREADRTARDVIAAAGYGDCFGHSLGHGVGLYIHEAPSLSPRAKDDSVLQRGNVVTVEPGIYIEGKYGCRIEDMVAIGHDGKVINFTKSPKELIEV
jgi:Xaa-Pro aminopeptidase